MKEKKVGIIGYPLSHSISPAIHNAAFKHLGLPLKYSAFEVKPEDLKKAVMNLRDEGVVGFNVTIPHKEAIVPILDEVTRFPRMIGAVNTVRNENGKLVGFNTDAPGFIESVRTDLKFDPKGKSVFIIGAGGAAKAVAAVLAEAEAQNIAITDIDMKKAERLSNYVGSLFRTKIISVPSGSARMKDLVFRADLLINASPIGMHPSEDKNPLPKGIELRANCSVFDLIYNPPETELMRAARQKGCAAVNGLGMLVRQGALSFTIWTGLTPPLEVMWQAAKEALGIR